MIRTVFAINRSTLAPLTGAALVVVGATWADVPVAVDWRELGGGRYVLEVDDAVAASGVVALVDFGVGGLERWALSVFEPEDMRRQALGVVVTSPDGALWVGAAPALGAYRWDDGTDRIGSAPAAVAISSLGADAVWLWLPSEADISAGVNARVDAPPGAAGLYWHRRTVPSTILDVDAALGVSIAALLATPSLEALVGQRVFPNLLPQEVRKPAITYYVVSDVPESSVTTPTASTTRNARVQIDVYSRTYAEAQQIARLVEVAMDVSAPSPGLSAWLETSRDLYDDVTQDHRVSMDFNVWR